MKKEKIIIGSRGSKLAIIYAQKAKDKIIQNTNFKDSFFATFRRLSTPSGLYEPLSTNKMCVSLFTIRFNQKSILLLDLILQN